MSRRVHVAYTPRELDGPMDVAIVVDVIRASTTIVTLVERGCRPLLLSATVHRARQARAAAPDLLLIGEQGALPPEGFDLGNSPVEVARAAVAGRGAALVTTNGVPAIHAAAQAGTVLVGCLRNARAVAEAAWAAAPEGGEIVIVCAGRAENPGGFGLDDAYGAGVLVGRLQGLGATTLTDAAEAARLLTVAEPDPLALFRRSAAGRNVTRLGLGDDVVFCAEVDRTTVVPRVGVDLVLLS